MANRDFFYFYAPTWDYPPGGPIKLGNVITSVKNPHRPLFCSPPPEESDVFKTEKKSVQYTKEKLRRGRFSILTKFLSVLGFGIDIGAEIDRSDEEIFVFDTLETTQFIPTPSYLKACVEAENVRHFLERSKYRKPVYIITGLKVVTGAQANTIKSRSLGGSVGVEVDATVWTAVPIGGGPGVEAEVGNKVSTKWEGSSDFVFGFRVSKVRVGEVVSEEDYRKGAMFERENTKKKEPELSVLGVEQPDARAEGFDLEELMDDEEVVFCAIPREEESEDEW
ncbi:uncharacterized protein NECHADRAFT_52455 [Fusarium vanettenii 77-13-4]|uniref:Uncharacterized protein n=1 Tax=Fusarium vanettenii (strain ATCC MYA-4622 / CBS 123669 / FGSC 9596 / NRRL 45880 / 77-13-4) TaxID=660122 RepID=C7ZK29_FUSV7|nr:uncharacterized protein NECHADRAFT_52455 [Fusarium vanettenii 77-13-4]EEU35606.1 hypothetical protein NECHADRAFT_52455 [Fusarium vanettenii 77-13-4]